MAWLKKWWRAIVTLWILLAFVAWHYESLCGFFFNSSCIPSYWDGIRWVVLLKWVSPYQTLLGGFAALAAGAFVLWSQKMQIDEHKRLIASSTLSELKASLALTRSECIHISNHLQNDNLRTSSASLEFTRASLPRIASFDPRLLHITMSVMHRLETAIREKERGSASSYSTTKFGWYSSIGMAYAEMIIQVIERLDRGDDIDVNHQSFDGVPLFHFLERRGQSPSALFELGAFFRWPDSYVSNELDEWND